MQDLQIKPHDIVHVDLGKRSYDIVIGDDLLSQSGQYIKDLLGDVRCAIITDENVAPHHLPSVENSLKLANISFDTLILPAGEPTKSFEALHQVVNFALEAKLERNDVMIALGGGVIGDLTGFACAIVRRGMQFIQMPTSLLAQVDSSVGGKTGINSPYGKNLVGAFYQPRLVLADTNTLDTLPTRDFRAGYGEVAKYGLINQPDFFSWMEANHEDIFSGGPARVEAIAQSCRSKAAIVARDEYEAGERALLNLGHTFGHALEGVTKYNAERLVHGEGVAIGMVLAHRFSAQMNQCTVEDCERVERHMRAVGLPTKITDIDGPPPSAEELMAYIAQDKKVSRGSLTFILTHGIGQSYIANDVPQAQVLSFLEEAISL